MCAAATRLRRARSLRSAASFVDEVGIALLFPRERCVLPSLWKSVAGDAPVVWAYKDDEGVQHFTPEMSKVWTWKDQLAEQRLCCAGKHLRAGQTLISFEMLPHLYALTGRSGEPDDFRDDPGVLSPLEFDIASCVLDADAPLPGPEIRRRIEVRESGKVNRAIESLQRMLILTKAGSVEQEHGWPAGTVDVLTRRYPMASLPDPDDARTELAGCVRRSAPDATDAEVASAFGWKRRR